MDPLTLMAISAGLNAGAGLIGSALKKKTPDYRAQAVNAGQNQVRQLQQDQDRSLQQLEGQMAAAGATGFQGVGAREGVARVGADAMATTRASVLDRIAQADMAQEQAEVNQHNETVDQQRNAIANIASGAGLLAMAGGGGDPTAAAAAQGPPAGATYAQVATPTLPTPNTQLQERPLASLAINPNAQGSVSVGQPQMLSPGLARMTPQPMMNSRPSLSDLQTQIFTELNPELAYNF